MQLKIFIFGEEQYVSQTFNVNAKKTWKGSISKARTQSKRDKLEQGLKCQSASHLFLTEGHETAIEPPHQPYNPQNLLYILTSIWVLLTTNTGLNLLFS